MNTDSSVKLLKILFMEERSIETDAEKIMLTLNGTTPLETGTDSNVEVLSTSSSSSVLQSIISKTNGSFRLAPQKRKGAYRLLLTSPDNKESISGLMKQALEGFDTEVIPPGAPKSSSGKYNTYLIHSPNKKEIIPVVFGAGGNRGHDFENDLSTSTISRTGKLWDSLIEKLGISQDEIERVEKISPAMPKGINPFRKTISNIGSAVADFGIWLRDGDVVYLSVKGLRGNTFANTGYSDAFVWNPSTRTVEEKPSRLFPMTDEFISALGVSKEKVAQGLTDYVNKVSSGMERMDPSPQFDSFAVASFLAAQVGFGFYYVKQLSGNDLKVVDLSSPDKTLELVGDVVSVRILYPYYTNDKQSSKQLSVHITTTTSKFLVEVRNTRGGILSQQLNIGMF